MANFVATLEAFTGLMTFALATGTLYGRFSRPVSKIKYSKNIIVAPYRDITGLQFMVANEMSSTLMEMEARVNIAWYENDDNANPVRRFAQVNLEIDKIALFPTSWILNHPIDEESVLYGRTFDDMKKMDLEVYVLLKGFDDVFSQTIYSRQSYTVDQFIYGAKFNRPWHLNENGKVTMDLTRVGDFVRAELPSFAVA
jgi:inward rectifier potassium channel